MTSLVGFMVDRAAGVTGDGRVYESRRRTARDLGVLVLLDATSSTSEESSRGQVFHQQRQIASNLTTALEALGDRVATYSFYSRGANSVRFLHIKSFDERYGGAAKKRLASVKPNGYTRLGAAIRHATYMINKQAGTTNKLLVVVGDGMPYDDGYEGQYAQEDCRKALTEAVTKGVACACIGVNSSTQPEIVERVWGHVSHRQLTDATDLTSHVRPLFRAALAEAAASRRQIN